MPGPGPPATHGAVWAFTQGMTEARLPPRGEMEPATGCAGNSACPRLFTCPGICYDSGSRTHPLSLILSRTAKGIVSHSGRANPPQTCSQASSRAAYYRQQPPFGRRRRSSPMSIRCVCRNGHVLRVKDSLAGAVGLARVQDPRERAPAASRVRVGRRDSTYSGGARPTPPQGYLRQLRCRWPTPPPRESIGRPTPKKSCERCNQEVSAGSHICPHCHTYIANLSDF